jgi:putative thioredoxin
MLGPILERLAEEAGGAWTLAKVDTDRNQSLAGRFGIQGIPAVKAFRNGRVVSEFVGAQPEPVVREFIAALGPSEADGAADKARGYELAGELDRAEEEYRRAIELDPQHSEALLGLGRVLVARDRYTDAIEVLEKVPLGTVERREAETTLSAARFRSDAELTGGEIGARRRLAADPGDLDARLALATALAAKGSYREALEGLLAVMERDSGEHRDRARKAVLDIFNLLGDEHELTVEYRARLATLLW